VLFFTALVDFVGAVVLLWLGLFLLGRGAPGRLTLRALVVLLALAVFFLGAYLNLYLRIAGIGNMRGIMLTVRKAPLTTPAARRCAVWRGFCWREGRGRLNQDEKSCLTADAKVAEKNMESPLNHASGLRGGRWFNSGPREIAGW